MSSSKENLNVINFFLLCFAILMFTYFIYFHQNISDENFRQYRMFENGVEEYGNSSWMKVVDDVCKMWYSENMTNIETVNCINDFVRANHNYKDHSGVADVEQLFNGTGADCESWTVFYEAYLRRYNWSTIRVHPPGHVYLTASKDNVQCIFDQGHADCWYTGEVEE